jgi:multidrug efflux pump subunit AcrA (membrane-fusion protein)
MKPGIQVKATVFVERLADVIAVPNQALVYEQDKAFVMVRRGSRAEKRPVETGARSLTLTVVTKGLAPGEVILLGGAEAAARGGKPS